MTNVVTYSEDFSKWTLKSGTTLNGNEVTCSGAYPQGLGLNCLTSGKNYTAKLKLKGKTGGEELRIIRDDGQSDITLTSEFKEYNILVSNVSDATFRIYAKNDCVFYIDYVQAVEGNILNAPYIPTSGTAVTRAADVAKVTSVNNLPAPGKPFYIVGDVDFGNVVTGHTEQYLNLITQHN